VSLSTLIWIKPARGELPCRTSPPFKLGTSSDVGATSATPAEGSANPSLRMARLRASVLPRADALFISRLRLEHCELASHERVGLLLDVEEAWGR